MTLTIERPIDVTPGRTGFGWRTILWNCNCHSFEDVTRALMVAIRCSPQKGMEFAHTVHTSGKAIVYQGHKERCEAVMEVLKGFNLKATMEN